MRQVTMCRICHKIGRMNTKKTGSAKAATETIALESINVLTPGSAPVALKLARIGGIGETVDGSVSWDRSRCSISPGIVAETLVSALLCGCRALYNMKSFWEESGCAAWFERNGVVPEQLNDDVYARLLDRFSECDMRKIVETVAFRLRTAHGIKVSTVHFDTTSVSVEGDYATTKEERGEESDGAETSEPAAADAEKPSFEIERGHSKDRRPDLKQIKIGLAVQEDGIPLTGELLSGSASDRTWNGDAVGYISELLGGQGVEDAVFVADSALVSKENLAELADGGMDFVTLLPGTFSLEKELKERAWREEKWTDLGALARDPDEKSARYKTRSVREEIEGRTYDFLVVHSTKLEALKERSLKSRFDRLGVELRKESLALRKREFACEEDARRGGAELLEKAAKYGIVAGFSVELEEKAVRGKGRPKKDAPPPATNRTWRAVVEIGGVEEKAWKSAMDRESTFILVYRMEKAVERKNPAEILRTYKNQNVVEQGFRFLKQPIYLGPVLLKKPERVEALGYVFLLVLLLAKYLEYRVRASLEKEGDALRVGGQKLARPTTQTILYHFGTVPLLESGGKRFMPNPPGGNGTRIMDALGFSWELYTHGDCEDRFMERFRS